MTGWGEVTATTPTANRAIAAVLRQRSDLLGGRVREDLPIYTHPRSQMYRSREAIAEEIGRIVASGHDAIKGPAASAS